MKRTTIKIKPIFRVYLVKIPINSNYLTILSGALG